MRVGNDEAHSWIVDIDLAKFFAKAYKARPHQKAVEKFKTQMKKLDQLIKGWVSYLKIRSMKGLCGRLDSHIRYRLRMCIWKHWKSNKRETSPIWISLNARLLHREEFTKQDKITLVVNDNGNPKATATEINIVGTSGASAFTTVKVGSSQVNVLAVVTDSENYNVAKATDAEAGSGNIKVTAKAAPVTETVNLYILPEGSQYPASATAEVIKDKGIKAAVKVNVKDATDTKSSKITFLSKSAKTPGASIVEKKVNLTTTFALGTDYKYSLSNAEIASVEKVPAAKEADVKNADSKTAMGAILSVTLSSAKDEITIVLDRDAKDFDQKGKKTYQVPVLVKFTAGAEEIVYFPIKPKAVPTVDSVKAEVEKKLKDLPVDAAAYKDGTAAAAKVQEAARALGTTVVDPLSGVDVTKITAAAKTVEGTKFEDEGTKGADGFKEGHHTVVVTLDDETKKGTEGYTAATLDVKVTEKAATVSLGDSLKAAINVYRLANQTPGAAPTEEPQKEVPTTMTRWTLQTELQDAADKADPGKYIVRVKNFDLETKQVPAPATTSAADTVNADEGTGKTIVSSLTFSYSVQLVQTGNYVAADGSESVSEVEFTVTMGTTTNEVNVPAAPKAPETPETPETPTSYEVTIQGVTASTVTYKIVAASEAAPEASAITDGLPASGKVSVDSGKKLYLKVVYAGGTVAVTKGSDNTPITGTGDVFEIGEITAAVTVTITETEDTSVED